MHGGWRTQRVPRIDNVRISDVLLESLRSAGPWTMAIVCSCVYGHTGVAVLRHDKRRHVQLHTRMRGASHFCYGAPGVPRRLL